MRISNRNILLGFLRYLIIDYLIGGLKCIAIGFCISTPSLSQSTWSARIEGRQLVR